MTANRAFHDAASHFETEEVAEASALGRTFTVGIALDDPATRNRVSELLRHQGFRIVEHATVEELARAGAAYDSACLPLEPSILRRLRSLREASPDLPYILVTSAHEIGDLARAVGAGAFDVVTAGEVERVVFSIRRAIEHRALLQKMRGLEATLRGRAPSTDAVAFPEGRVVPLSKLQRDAIEHALRVTRGCMTRAAVELGMGRATLYRRLDELGLRRVDAQRR